MTDLEVADREDAKRVHDGIKGKTDDLIRAAIEGATFTLKGLIGVNGAAVIALLGFLATLASSEAGRGLAVGALVAPLTYFAWGVLLALGASMAAYFTNFGYGSALSARKLNWLHPYSTPTFASRGWLAFAISMHLAGFLASVVSLVCLIWGIQAVTLALPVVFANP